MADDVVQQLIETQVLPLLRELRDARREKGYFTIAEAASFVSCGYDHVLRHIHAGNIPVSNIGTSEGPDYRIARTDLIAWMNERKNGVFISPKKSRPKVVQPGPYQSRHSPHRDRRQS